MASGFSGGFFMGRASSAMVRAIFGIFRRQNQTEDTENQMLEEGWLRVRMIYGAKDAYLFCSMNEYRNYPAHVRKLAEAAALAEPRQAFARLVQDVCGAGTDINDLPPAKRRSLSYSAIAVLTDDAQYARWRAVMSPESQRACDTFRADWQGEIAISEQAKLRLEAGLAEFRANRERWETARFLPLPLGLTGWLMTQPPEVWHVWAESLRDASDLTPDLATAIKAVADHPACNRGTALRLLVTALFTWIDADKPHADRIAARIAERLERRDFAGPSFAVETFEWTFAESLMIPGKDSVTLSSAALGERGDLEVKTLQPFEAGFPYQPIIDWLERKGA